MHIEQLDPADDARVADIVDLWHAAHAVDRPRDPAFTPSYERGRVVAPLPDEPTTYHLAYDGDRLVGVADIELPHLDNTGTGWTQIHVHPRARRRGVGAVLWDHVAQTCRDAGRKLVVFESPVTDPPGTAPSVVRDELPGQAFAHRVGAELGILSARRRLVVDAGSRALAERLAGHARGHAAGYELHSFVGASPPQWIEGMAYLHGRMSTDAPMDDLEWEPENYDADRLRKREDVFGPWGQLVHNTVAVHAASGAIAGFTTIGVNVDDLTVGQQWNTIVDPDHRGHRLGTLLKVENLRFTLAHQPRVGEILTWNAVSNGPMIAVNEAMGFRLWDHWAEWQVRL